MLLGFYTPTQAYRPSLYHRNRHFMSLTVQPSVH